MALRNAVQESDATMTRSGFIHTSNGSFITIPRALELIRYKRNAYLKKLKAAVAEDAWKQALQDLRVRSTV